MSECELLKLALGAVLFVLAAGCWVVSWRLSRLCRDLRKGAD